jgi:hypothetical protein
VGVCRHPVGELHPSKVPQHIIYVRAETQIVECLIVEISVWSFFSSSSDNIMKPYVEYRGVYGGGADERVDRRGGTGGSSVRP